MITNKVLFSKYKRCFKKQSIFHRNVELSQLFKSLKFGNGSRMSDKNLAIIEFKYHLNKVVKSTKIKKSYRIYYFHFTQITDKNSQFSFKNWRFSTFTTFLLHSWNSVDADLCISSAYVMSGTKQSFCFLNIPASRGG